MFKKFHLNPSYSFALNGDYLFNNEVVSSKEGDFVEIELDGKRFVLSKQWLGLISHYEVKLQLEHIFKISFHKCDSKVIGLKCGYSMCIKQPIHIGDGFFVISGFTDFAIKSTGEMKSIRYNRHMKPHMGPYGYPVANIYDPDKGNWRGCTLHLLLARTFIPNNDPEFKCFVNHKDGNKLNYSLRNLEWVTSQENNKHAVETGLRNDNNPCEVLDVVSGEVTKYSSVGNALSYIGLKSKFKRLNKRIGNDIVPHLFLGKYEVRLISNQRPWFYNAENVKTEKTKFYGPYQAKHIETNVVIESKSLSGLVNKTSVSEDRIRCAMSQPEPTACCNFLFRMKCDDEWPVDYKLTTFTPPRGMQLTNKVTGEVVLLKSIRETTRFLSIDKRTLKSRMTTTKLHNDWILEEIS